MPWVESGEVPNVRPSTVALLRVEGEALLEEMKPAKIAHPQHSAGSPTHNEG